VKKTEEGRRREAAEEEEKKLEEGRLRSGDAVEEAEVL
jgi:hypothetical protein